MTTIDNLFSEDTNKLRLTHFPQVGKDIKFILYVDTPEEAWKIANVLWQYDIFQYENNIKPDFSNATFLDEYDISAGEWVSWYSEDGYEWEEYASEYIDDED